MKGAMDRLIELVKVIEVERKQPGYAYDRLKRARAGGGAFSITRQYGSSRDGDGVLIDAAKAAISDQETLAACAEFRESLEKAITHLTAGRADLVALCLHAASELTTEIRRYEGMRL